MTLPTNDDFANRELSIDELEAIAAGWPHWVHSAVNWVGHEVKAFVTNPVVAGAAAAVIAVGAFVAGGGGGGNNMRMN